MADPNVLIKLDAVFGALLLVALLVALVAIILNPVLGILGVGGIGVLATVAVWGYRRSLRRHADTEP